MAFDARILSAALVILAVKTTFADEIGRCDYMRQVPRPPTPEFPDRNFDGLSWSQRPLLPVAHREDLCMDAYTEGVFNTQLIYMEESIEGDIAIAELNYKGTQTPYVVVPFVLGSFGLLLPVIRRIPENTGPWHLVITNKQDFEANMRNYMFHIRVDDEPVMVTVSLNIINIDDNAPQIEMDGPCRIDEAGETGESECRYRVQDIDGLISTGVMRYTIESERGDEQFFEFKREPIAGTVFFVDMVMFIKKPLDFVANQLHIFRVTARDSLPNNRTINMMVEVQNIESRAPNWTEIFSMQQYNEKWARSFRVRAIDGDTGIDAPIFYRLVIPEEDKKLDLYTLEHIYTEQNRVNGAELHVAAIDRDTLQREIFELSIVAYKVAQNGSIFETSHDIVIIINDINDQTPLPYKESYSITIDEEVATTLDLVDFGFHDADLGPHARYEVKLESVFPPNAHEAFYVAPTQGYQSQSFIIGTQNHHMLDYENEDFQNKIQIKAIATDMHDNTKVGVATIDIYLTNWNDELPMFAETAQTVEFEETVGEGFPVATVRAVDIDVGDVVEHSIMGNVDYLRIDKETGEIFVAREEAFNYHRQSELFIQIRADDTLSTKLEDGRPNHTNTSQLVIKLIDINNTPPTLRLPRVSPSVEENEPDGVEITDENSQIQATDPDTTAELRFEIDWENSYATKQGRETPTVEYHNCVRIETVYPGESRGIAVGRVLVQQIRPGVTIDYEEFEVLYLRVRVRDLNTAIGEDYDEATFTIPIIDMNDNAPLWGEGQLAQVFRVRERSASGVVIGSLTATDIDGPLYNQIRYKIAPKEGTPPDLVAIDSETGQITVKKNEEIDADVPPRFHLYYDVYATDQCFLPEAECPPDKTINTTPGEIAIEIIDTNNKVPQFEKHKFRREVPIYEASPHGHHVENIVASDLDRDLPYNNVSYQINYVIPRIRDFFAIDLVTGEITVHYTGPDILDRDGDEPQHRIYFNAIDNFLGAGNRNQIEDESILVILLDINDNAPEMPDPSTVPWSESENTEMGYRILPPILAHDRDEPGNPNSKVAYRVLGLTIDRDIEIPQDLFKIITIETPQGIDQTGELETTMDLKGYWGTYQILLEAYDHGDPSLDSNATYPIVIRPYNFHNPVFVFPAPGTPIRLSRERALVNAVLITAGAQGVALQQLSATDEDGLHAGTVSFSVVGDDTAANYFDIWNDGDNVGTLYLKQALPPGAQQFQLTLRATDAGDEPGPLSSDVTVTVVFVAQEEPVFTPSTDTVSFFEGQAGMSERHQLLAATDPKNIYCDEDIDCYDVFYSIIGGNEGGHFALEGHWISLRRELDFAESRTHTLYVAASNTPAVITAPPASTLTVTVNVREVNPRPRFEEPAYFAGISNLNNINDNLRTLQATHSDGLSITYAIDPASMEADPSLQAVQDSAFNVNAETGVLTLNFQPTAFMHGMFQFDVVATDTNDQTDRAEVKVYMISSRNRVYFRFRNTEQVIRDNENFIARTFSNVFELICNIDQILPANDDSGAAMETVTEVRAHFIRDNLPVPSEDIDDLRSNTPLIHQIWEIFDDVDLVLMGVHTGDSPTAGGDYALAVYILSGLAGLFAILCLVLIIAFVMRNRALNRRIEGLTKYNSMDSGLNGVGLTPAAPGTNKHAAEGSNPIWNETIKAPDFDAISEVSNDSDLIGIEDLPQFRSDYFPPEMTDSLNGDGPGEVVTSTRNPIANHQNNFGFNTTPFSPEFANTQLRK